MRTLYVDSGAFLALARPKDRAHDGMREHFLLVRAQGDVLVTSEPVVAETATRLRYDAGLPAALRFQRTLDAGTAVGTLRVRESDDGLRRAAFEVMARHADLSLSYADCVGSAVANEVSAAAVLGLDNDFRILGHVLEP